MRTTAEPRTRDGREPGVPEFDPHPWLRNGHLQTVVGRYLPTRPFPHETATVELPTEDGDRLVVLDSAPTGWLPGHPLAIFVHGLAGCAEAPYVVRVAEKLWGRGVRSVRMNLRGAGAGYGKARGIYHAGRSDDLRRVATWAASTAPGSPLALIGYSLGGNIVLKLAAEASTIPLPGLDAVIAANPPIDLAGCCRHIQRPSNRIYDRNFVRQLRAEVVRLHELFPDLGPVNLPKALTLYDFDDLYTAPRNGFEGADDYYRKSSAGPLIPSIEVPGLVLHAEDDPFIPAESFRSIRFPKRLALELTRGGGHLGYVSRRAWNGDRRWLDHRITAWLVDHWGLA